MRVRVDGRFPQHPKVRRAAAALGGVAPLGRVCGLWLVAACYAAEHGTGGRVPAAVVTDAAVDRAPAEVVAVLVAAGLLEPTEDAAVYQLHDFAVYNGTEAQAQARAEAAREAGRRSAQKRVEAVKARKKTKKPVTVAVMDGPDALRELWNRLAVAPVRPCLALSPKRRLAAAIRLKERPIAEWEAVIARVMASAFCRGGGYTGWVASFDWLLRPDSALRVLEGKYDEVHRPLSREERIREAADRAVAALKRGEW